jgi:hypothetical protein
MLEATPLRWSQIRCKQKWTMTTIVDKGETTGGKQWVLLGYKCFLPVPASIWSEAFNAAILKASEYVG